MRNAWQKRVAGLIACNVALLFAPVAVSNAQEDKPARQTAAILGRLVPVRTVAVVARVSGVLRELHVQEGDRVEQGQVIAQLDAHRAEFALALARGRVGMFELELRHARGEPRDEMQLAKAKIAEAQALIEFSQTRLARATKLFKRGAVTQDEVKRHEAETKTHKAQLQQLQAHLKRLASGPSRKEIGMLESKLELAKIELKAAEFGLSQCTLHAPISGTVLRLRSAAGDAIDARGSRATVGETVAEIADLSKMQVIARLPFGALARWKPGTACSVQIVGDDGRQRRGKVTRLAPVVDAKTNTVTVYIAVAPEDKKSFWRPGSPVRVGLLDD